MLKASTSTKLNTIRALRIVLSPHSSVTSRFANIVTRFGMFSQDLDIKFQRSVLMIGEHRSVDCLEVSYPTTARYAQGILTAAVSHPTLRGNDATNRHW